MTSSIHSFGGEVPGHYHLGLGPLLFESYAHQMAERAAQLQPVRVLETACGTGIVTRQLALALGGQAEVVATDLNPDMLARAARTVESTGVQLRTADMTALPFQDGAFDLVVCQFGLMFAPDRLTAAREARRVVGPGGTWLFSTWGPLAHNPVVQVAAGALAALFPDQPPSFYRTPFSMSEAAPLHQLVLEAGFSGAEIEIVRSQGSSLSARAAALGLVLGNPVAGEISAAHGHGALDRAVDAVTQALAARHGQGLVHAELEALIVTAHR
jgi:SAM-dependent methyltransferase